MRITYLVLIIVLYGCWSAYAERIPKERAVNAIIGEAEGEGYRGMLAVACAIRNRGSLRGVYGERSKRVVNHLYDDDTKRMAYGAWFVSQDDGLCEELIHGATHWEGTSFKTPWWAEHKQVTAVIGNQRFYK
jgi:hypothetical protein